MRERKKKVNSLYASSKKQRPSEGESKCDTGVQEARSRVVCGCEKRDDVNAGPRDTDRGLRVNELFVIARRTANVEIANTDCVKTINYHVTLQTMSYAGRRSKPRCSLRERCDH
jgi:hypothetical protein